MSTAENMDDFNASCILYYALLFVSFAPSSSVVGIVEHAQGTEPGSVGITQ